MTSRRQAPPEQSCPQATSALPPRTQRHLVVTGTMRAPELQPLHNPSQPFAMASRGFQPGAQPYRAFPNSFGAPEHALGASYAQDQLPASFYTQPPPDHPAIFSTKRGELPFRYMHHFLPEKNVHLWDKDEIQGACNSLRLMYWDLMKGMVRPTA